jgi:DNA-binding NarL/FixJ family response regulator
MSGIDATRAIRSEAPEAKIIALTSYDGDPHPASSANDSTTAIGATLLGRKTLNMALSSI